MSSYGAAAPGGNGNGSGATGEHRPVADWETDFDHVSPEFAADPYPIYDLLRNKCPVAHSGRYGGMWIPTTYEDLAEIAHDTEHFSSRKAFVSVLQLGPMGDAAALGAPITSDPPYHTEIRRLLLPAFAPAKINALEGRTREICNDLIDKFIDQGQCDAAVDYAQHIPVAVIAKMLGIPEEDGDIFRDFIHRILEEGPDHPEILVDAAIDLLGYLYKNVQAHKEEQRSDLIEYLLTAEVDGRRLEEYEIQGILFLLLVAGIDTTWSAIGSSLLHLATHPEDRKRLVDEPELIPTATEEFLRAYAPVTMGREVVEDIDYKGCPMKAGDQVLMPFPAGNRDSSAFPDADKVVIDREVNRHYAFGVGIHRCLGSNLARLEIKVALEEWLKRIPEYHLADPDAITWSVGQVRGPRVIPVAFG